MLAFLVVVVCFLGNLQTLKQIRAWRGWASSQATPAIDSKRTALAEHSKRFHPLTPVAARLLSRSAERTTEIAGKVKVKLQPATHQTPIATAQAPFGEVGERVLLGNSASEQSLALRNTLR